MSNALHIFVTILVLIVMLGILVAAHEAGHLFMAKKFNVYCEEYSIGFGPKLFTHRGKGKETAFSIRGIPLGGYVSMYGEGTDEPNEEGKVIPPERSLEGVKAWQRSLILLAGIFVNLILSFLFCLIYATCFPIYTNGNYYAVSGTATPTSSEVYGTDKSVVELFIGKMSDGTELQAVRGFFLKGEGVTEKETLCSPALVRDSSSSKYGFVIDDDVLISRGELAIHASALYYPKSESSDNDLLSSLTFYGVDSNVDVKASCPVAYSLGIKSVPNFSTGINLQKEDIITIDLTTITPSSSTDLGASYEGRTTKSVIATYDGTALKGASLSTFSSVYQESFGTKLLRGCQNWLSFFAMIGSGLAALFTFNFNSLGGVVAMGAGLSQLSTQIGWGKTFFFYGGFISLNLAIFNLLPFPGLDGWGLLVTIIEKIRKKKVSQKTKAIVSNVGLGLLFAFAIFITVKDIIQFLV